MSDDQKTEHSRHKTPPDPRLQNTLTPEQTSALERRVQALEALLVAKGLVLPETVEKLASIYENDIGPMNGTKVVARAWADPAYKQRLLADGTAAIAEFGLGGMQGEHLVVVENTPAVHNVVVCSLCSCYPWPVLGLPPSWYKSTAYRSRVVIDPRSVLREFGQDLDESVEIRVWDSSADIRYMVLPEHPSGTDQMTEDELAGLVTRDAMIGVSRCRVEKGSA